MPRLLVIGGNAAGMSAASRVAGASPGWEVSVFDSGGDLSWGACGMPYVFSREAGGFDELFALSPDEITGRGIEARTFLRAVELAEGRKKVVFSDEKSGRLSEESYDALLIATGSVPVIPEIRGFDGDNLFVLHTLADGRRLSSFMERERPRSVCILGGGYIAVEMAETLTAAGIHTTMVVRSDGLLGKLNPDFRERLASVLEENGVRLLRGAAIAEVRKKGGAIESLATSRGTVSADIFLCATGVRAATDFLKDSPVSLGERGGIEVDGMCRTGMSSVWAAGDCCCVKNFITGKSCYVPLGTTANRMGRIAGTNIAGGREELPGVLGTAIARAFGFEIAVTGLSLSQALKEGFDSEEASIRGRTRPRYFRGGKDIFVSAVGERGGKILGGQVAGGDAKGRIDTLAALIQGGISARDAEHLDLAYAPPFSTVRDPLLTCLSLLKKKLYNN